MRRPYFSAAPIVTADDPFPPFVPSAPTPADKIRDRRIAYAVFALTATAAVVAAFGWGGVAADRDAAAIMAGAGTAGVVGGGVVSLWLLVGRLRTGVWPELEAETFGTGRTHRAFASATRHRPSFSRAKWVATFYPGPVPPPGLVADVLEELGRGLGFHPEEEGLHPRDPLGFWDPEVDFADIVRRLERAFEVPATPDPWRGWDGTFDGLVRWVTSRSPAATGDPPA